MSPELERLWALRELDEQVLLVVAELSRIPAQRASLGRRVQDARHRLETTKSRLADLQKARREREREVESVSEQERKFQSQLPAVKKNEEYTALLHEIAAAKQKRSDLETQVLLALDDEEVVQRERPEAEGALGEAEAEERRRTQALDEEQRVLEARKAELDQGRARELSELSPAMRARYERAHSRDGRAVVPILKNACGGCFRTQPPHVLQEAKRGDRMLACDGCGRLLVWPPEGAAS